MLIIFVVLRTKELKELTLKGEIQARYTHKHQETNPLCLPFIVTQ